MTLCGEGYGARVRGSAPRRRTLSIFWPGLSSEATRQLPIYRTWNEKRLKTSTSNGHNVDFVGVCLFIAVILGVLLLIATAEAGAGGRGSRPGKTAVRLQYSNIELGPPRLPIISDKKTIQ
jgi:hypothetical protein